MAAGLLALIASTAQAKVAVRIYKISLKDVPSQFVLRANAPKTTFALTTGPTSVTAGGPESTFGKAGAANTVFRQAEVPPARVAMTRTLMTELRARTTPTRDIVIDLPADVLFDFDKANLRPDAEPQLAKAAEVLRSYPDAPVAINGHTDAKGDDLYNNRLSQRRAAAVADRLKAATSRGFKTQGFGERRPVAPNQAADGRDDPIGRQKNRRVEIVISPPLSPSN